MIIKAAEDMGKRDGARCRTKYSWKTIGKQMLNVYTRHFGRIGTQLR